MAVINVRLIFLVIANVGLHGLLKILSVLLVGIFIGTSDNSIKNVVYLESFFLLMHVLLLFVIFQKRLLIKTKTELIIIFVATALIIYGLYFFKYIPPFGVG